MLPDKYKLDITEHNKILDKIRTFLFSDKKPVQNPQIYILGGQPGAGKSVLTQRVLLSGGNDNFVSINGDEFRTLHPQAKEIFQNHDKDFALMTDADTRLWTSEIFDEAIKNHYNIIFEGTMRTNQICNTISRLQKESYKINVLVMAVPEIKSRVSIYSRYQEQLEKYPIARFTSKFSHDAAYFGMLDTLKEIEDKHLYDTITVCNRDNQTIFQTGDKDIVKAITVEREKPLSSQDIKDLSSDIDGLLLKMTARNENLVYIEDLKSLKEQIIAQKPHNFYTAIDKMTTTVKSIKNINDTNKQVVTKSDNKFSYKNNTGKEI
ncbi:MAG: zeta toxin family protein [Alphaproteobacteria bacterium]|nr:zeta toxin family protein [Alphaproteobacteria bacterium]